jgi:branched-subunit amino acid aminotransferase/4-amino-4-deoxychorismate lyase
VETLGHQQILWLFEDKIIEVGSSNIFFVFKDKTGGIEIATPLL